jgi:ABC-type transport system involved in cytochrome c biogenesis permease subunit
MTRGIDFAPVSDRESTLLRFAAGYFVFNGVVNGLVLTWLLVSFPLGLRESAATLADILSVIVLATLTVGLVWTGLLLGRRSRRGGLLALCFTLIPIVFAPTRFRPGTTTLVFSVLGVIVLSIIWRELR